jgi:hypothetical protein
MFSDFGLNVGRYVAQGDYLFQQDGDTYTLTLKKSEGLSKEEEAVWHAEIPYGSFASFARAVVQLSGHLRRLLPSTHWVCLNQVKRYISPLLSQSSILSRLLHSHQCQSHATSLENLGAQRGYPTRRRILEFLHRPWSTLQLIFVWYCLLSHHLCRSFDQPDRQGRRGKQPLL